MALLDLNNEASINACAEDIARRYGKIDALILNAAMAYKYSDQTPWVQKTRNTVTANFFGNLAACKAFHPLINDGGHLITVASM
eukprot:CAMPEP_0197685888 /NCGR_PEP_ID=MMETSP1338-20131121/101657_1 /TAXON_ID=43686 ORGANISM="Pelagodinium beii, Strain RCC1491" /NCGR_SAMPLE_ID=MMETSP1338 /ASSEMBLY_ACC=CAM_ASM_000754 /LENGTH=83 /DNA_ID=CAMNT_0043267769 /DNA_START=35 /DNA_END=283 /DNA_ORIENTATION=+